MYTQTKTTQRYVCVVVRRRVMRVYVGSTEGNKLMGQSIQIIETIKTQS